MCLARRQAMARLEPLAVAVDYAFLPRGTEDEFVSHCRRLFAKRYPDINGLDFTSIIDQRSYDRLAAALDDARLKGARLVNLAEGQTPDKSKRRFPPRIVLNVTGERELMRREIFGPILPILTYGKPEEVVDAIDARDRPLALYPFTRDAATRRFLIAHTRSEASRSMTRSCTSSSTTCRSVAWDRAAWGIIMGRRASRLSRSSGPCSRRAGSRRCRPSCSRLARIFRAASSTSWCG